MRWGIDGWWWGDYGVAQPLLVLWMCRIDRDSLRVIGKGPVLRTKRPTYTSTTEYSKMESGMSHRNVHWPLSMRPSGWIRLGIQWEVKHMQVNERPDHATDVGQIRRRNGQQNHVPLWEQICSGEGQYLQFDHRPITNLEPLSMASWCIGLLPCLIFEMHPRIPDYGTITRKCLLCCAAGFVLVSGGGWLVVDCNDHPHWMRPLIVTLLRMNYRFSFSEMTNRILSW